jgi:pimeloyl-ACP methyl ester carboxylesterase
MEKVVSVPGISNLAGIVSQPDDSFDVTRVPACVFLNAGILHRIGSGRIHVKLARMFAERGMLSLRLDHSGIGDSDARRGSNAFLEAGRQEVIDAMDFLQGKYGVDRFIIFGLCSGADVGFETAYVDNRIVGLIQLDAWKYVTNKARAIFLKEYYGPQILHLSSWLRFIRNRFKEVAKKLKKANDLDEWFSEPDYIRVTPPIDYVAERLNTLIARNVRLYIAFSGTLAYGMYRYEGQYRDAFGDVEFGDCLHVRYYGRTTHLFTDLDHQRQLTTELLSWLASNGFLDEPESRAGVALAHP